MKISNKGLELIKEFEGCALKAYKCPAGVWTIGYGHTGMVDGKPICAGMTITKAKASELLAQDTGEDNKYVKAVNNLKAGLNQHQFDALVSFAYNLGPYIFKGTLLNAIKTKNWASVTSQMLQYNKARDPKTGKLVILGGLVRRRKAETTLFNTPCEPVTTKITQKISGKENRVDCLFKNGTNHVNLKQVAKLLGKNAGWISASRKGQIQGRDLPTILHEGSSYCPIREIAKACGLKVVVIGKVIELK